MLSLVNKPGNRIAVLVSGLRQLSSTSEELIWPGTGTPTQPTSAVALKVKSSNSDDIAPASRRQQFVLDGSMQPAVNEVRMAALTLDATGDAFTMSLGERDYSHTALPALLDSWSGVVGGDLTQGGVAGIQIGEATYGLEFGAPAYDEWHLMDLSAIVAGDECQLSTPNHNYFHTVAGAKDKYTFTVESPIVGGVYTLFIGTNDYSHTVAGGGPATKRTYTGTVALVPDPPLGELTLNGVVYGALTMVGTTTALATALADAAMLGTLAVVIIGLSGTPSESDGLTISVGTTDYGPYLAGPTDTLANVITGILASIGDTDPDYSFMDVGGGNIAAIAKARGVKPAVTVGSTGAIISSANVIVVGRVGQSAWNVTADGSDLTIEHATSGTTTDTAVGTTGVIELTKTIDGADSTDEDAGAVANALRAAAASDPSYDVTNVDGVLTVEAKAVGVGLDVHMSTTGLSGYSVVHDVTGVALETGPEILAALALLADEDPDYTFTYADGVLVMVAHAYADAATITFGSDGTTAGTPTHTVVGFPQQTGASLASAIAADAAGNLSYDVTTDGDILLVAQKVGAATEVVVTSIVGGGVTLTMTHDIIGRAVDDAGSVVTAIAEQALNDPDFQIEYEGNQILIIEKHAGVSQTAVNLSATGDSLFELAELQMGMDADVARIASGLVDPTYDIIVGTINSAAENDQSVAQTWYDGSVTGVYQYVHTAEDTPETAALGLAAFIAAANGGSGDANYTFEAIGNTVVATSRVPGGTLAACAFTAGPGDMTSVHTQSGENAGENVVTFEHVISDTDTIDTVITAMIAVIRANGDFLVNPVDGQTDRFTFEAREPTSDWTFIDACINNQQGESTTLAFTPSTLAEPVIGPGVQFAVLDAIDALGDRVQAVVKMAGTDEVSLDGTFLRVLGISTLRAGTGGVAAGQITVTNDAGDELYATIETNGTQDSQARFVVPAGFNFYVTGFLGSASTNAPHLRLRASRGQDGSPLVGSSAIWADVFLALPVEQTFADAPIGPFHAGDDVWMTAEGQDSDQLSASFRGVLMPVGQPYS